LILFLPKELSLLFLTLFLAIIDNICHCLYPDRAITLGAAMPMNISLTPQLEEMIRQKVASGSYTSASEVVREALRLMELEDELRNLKLRQLREDIQEGLRSGTPKSWNPEALKRAARKRKNIKTKR
jgi:antitoxin ParD1/3/4